ncbi:MULTISPECIES: hypothetical protein [Marinobacter]|jgi:hypothetical protein|uniref:hypothetical protein n=1 Tax=Marinobacter TaxID=2742 RepID=UPI003B42C12B|nr:hypothetical protein PBN92_11195 [Marinobacter alkaliphilus]
MSRFDGAVPGAMPLFNGVAFLLPAHFLVKNTRCGICLAEGAACSEPVDCLYLAVGVAFAGFPGARAAGCVVVICPIYGLLVREV